MKNVFDYATMEELVADQQAELKGTKGATRTELLAKYEKQVEEWNSLNPDETSGNPETPDVPKTNTTATTRDDSYVVRSKISRVKVYPKPTLHKELKKFIAITLFLVADENDLDTDVLHLTAKEANVVASSCNIMLDDEKGFNKSAYIQLQAEAGMEDSKAVVRVTQRTAGDTYMKDNVEGRVGYELKDGKWSRLLNADGTPKEVKASTFVEAIQYSSTTKSAIRQLAMSIREKSMNSMFEDALFED